MAPATRRSFSLTNDVANRMLVPLLKSAAGSGPGRRLALVEYVGRRSGQRHQLVTQYVIEGSTVHIRVGRPERKTWWRNFTTRHPVHLRLAGRDYDTTARVVRDTSGVSVVADLEHTTR